MYWQITYRLHTDYRPSPSNLTPRAACDIECQIDVHKIPLLVYCIGRLHIDYIPSNLTPRAVCDIECQIDMHKIPLLVYCIGRLHIDYIQITGPYLQISRQGPLATLSARSMCIKFLCLFIVLADYI